MIDGSLPPSLGALPALTVLDMSNNSLTGPLPSFASTKLSGVDLSFNKLTGGIPAVLAGHPALHSLDLKGNQISGLPTKWLGAPADGEAAPLSYLRCVGEGRAIACLWPHAACLLQQAAPPACWHSNCPLIFHLSLPLPCRLSGNKLAGIGFPTALANYPNLTAVLLGDNGMR